jgi:hypothetical protein
MVMRLVVVCDLKRVTSESLSFFVLSSRWIQRSLGQPLGLDSTIIGATSGAGFNDHWGDLWGWIQRSGGRPLGLDSTIRGATSGAGFNDQGATSGAGFFNLLSMTTWFKSLHWPDHPLSKEGICDRLTRLSRLSANLSLEEKCLVV